MRNLVPMYFRGRDLASFKHLQYSLRIYPTEGQVVVYTEHFIKQFKCDKLLFLYKNAIINVRLFASLTLDLL